MMKRAHKSIGAVIAVVLLLSMCAFADRTVRDEFDRPIKVPDHPRRLVCLAPSITQTVFELGRGDDVVGVTDYTKYPPGAKQKPSVGGVINPSLERLVALKPDLVLAIEDLNNRDLTQRIEKLGLPVYVVHPQSLQDIYRSIHNIGMAIDAERAAEALVASLRGRELAVRARVAGQPRPNVFFLLWPDPVMSAGHGAFITELIEIAGAKSTTADLPNEWPRVSLETVLAQQPEYVLLVRGSEVTLDSLRRQGGWERLDAIKNGKVFYTDERIEYPSPLAIDALEDLAKQFHPTKAGPTR